jgi:hypothetical protein
MAHRTTAAYNVNNLYVDKDEGNGIVGTVPNMAVDKNMMQEEICHTVEDGGQTLASSSNPDNYQIERAIADLALPIMAVIPTLGEITPVPYNASRNASHTDWPDYCPFIPIHDKNHDVSTTEVNAATVAAFRNVVFKVGNSAVSQFAVNVASGVVTMSVPTTEWERIVSNFVEMGLVARYYAMEESATFAASGALYTGARQYSARIGSTDYAISAADTVTDSITLTSPPADGAYTIEFHPFAVAGEALKFRLRRVSGSAPFASNDFSGEIMGGGAIMDRFQEHGHAIPASVLQGYGATTIHHNIPTGTGDFSDVINSNDVVNTTVGAPVGHNNGTPRNGKNTRSMTFGTGMYVHVRGLKAATWTSSN